MLTGFHRLKLIFAAIAFVGVVGGFAYWRVNQSQPATEWSTAANANAALDELRKGNARFVASARILSTDTVHDAEHRREVARQQHPFAVILACADSRVCPEFIFDQRLGSIFEIRNAGNVVDDDVLGSFEYAVEHLHVPLMLVLGHKGCGAIHAVCEAGDKPLHGHLGDLQKHMKGLQPFINAEQGERGSNLINRLSKENVRQQARTLLQDSQALKMAVVKDEAQLKCGVYDMLTGDVEFFDP